MQDRDKNLVINIITHIKHALLSNNLSPNRVNYKEADKINNIEFDVVYTKHARS